MAGSIESFDIALNSASRKRDSATERIPLMWAGMAEAEFFGSLAERCFRVALKSFLVLVNAYTLSSLGTVQFDEDYRELPWGFRSGEASSSLFQHPAIAEALSSEPPFWAADTSFAGASFYVYAPKATTITAYRKGAASAGAYLERFSSHRWSCNCSKATERSPTNRPPSPSTRSATRTSRKSTTQRSRKTCSRLPPTVGQLGDLQRGNRWPRHRTRCGRRCARPNCTNLSSVSFAFRPPLPDPLPMARRSKQPGPWGKKWGKNPHRLQPIPADLDLAKPA